MQEQYFLRGFKLRAQIVDFLYQEDINYYEFARMCNIPTRIIHNILLYNSFTMHETLNRIVFVLENRKPVERKKQLNTGYLLYLKIHKFIHDYYGDNWNIYCSVSAREINKHLHIKIKPRLQSISEFPIWEDVIGNKTIIGVLD